MPAGGAGMAFTATGATDTRQHDIGCGVACTCWSPGTLASGQHGIEACIAGAAWGTHDVHALIAAAAGVSSKSRALQRATNWSERFIRPGYGLAVAAHVSVMEVT